jgi:transcriptional regulator with XRE-family HTH domain
VKISVKRNRFVNYLPSNISFLREKKQWSQQDLGDCFGYTNKAISAWELGNRSPDPFDLLELSRIFDVSIDVLMNVDLEAEHYNIKKYTKSEVKEKVTHIVSNSELEDNKKQMIINVIEVSCDE